MVEPGVFTCEPATLGRPIPADDISDAYVFDDAVGRIGTPIARDIYVNGFKLDEVTGEVGQGERAAFILRANGSVVPSPGTATPR